MWNKWIFPNEEGETLATIREVAGHLWDQTRTAILRRSDAPDEFVAVRKAPAAGGVEALSQPYVVKAVAIQYHKADRPAGSRWDSIEIGQGLNVKTAGLVVGAKKTGVQDIGGFAADVWEGKTGQGDNLVALFWEDSSRGVGFNILSGASKAEALRVARSFP